MNIAIVKLSSLGDVVHALPVAATLRARVREARITWLVEHREAAILTGHPALDEIITVDTRRWRQARSPGALAAAGRAFAALSRRLRAARFDVALDLQGLLKSGILMALTRAPLRIGFQARACREPLGALFTNRRLARPAGRHVVEHYLSLLEPLGIGAPVLDFRLPVDQKAETRMDDVLAASGLKPRDRLVVVNPGAGRPGKRWPVDRFRAVAHRLAREGEAHVLVVWGPGEESAARAIADGGDRSRVVLAPRTDLFELIAVLRRASLLVAADTGPLHLAAAGGTPCLGIYGPTSPARNGPYGTGHRTLQGHDGRVEAVGVDEVFGAAVQMLR
ncbi:MAG: lipopolysaccharide heptosyltransferase I [Candidatus Rokuibacteriota bacterium]